MNLPDQKQLEACAKRRHIILEQLGEDLLVLPSSFLKQKNSDVHFLFRQDSDFHYLCAFPEPDSLLILDPLSDTQKVTLVVPARDPLKELWDGPRFGCEGALEHFQVDQALPTNKIHSTLPNIFKNRSVIFARLDHLSPMLNEVEDIIKQEAKTLSTRRIRPFIHDMRLIKDSYELECLREANRVASAGHTELMKKASTYKNESQLDAEFRYFCAMQGQADMAYPAIVASGSNATCLHYIVNNRTYQEDELILVDAGSSHNLYAADITRVFPTSGKFTAEGKALYQVTLEIQKKVLAKISTKLSLMDLNEYALQESCKALCEMGIIKDSYEVAMKNGTHRKYCPHGIGHHLGLDVHDCSHSTQNYRNSKKKFNLQPGMVITIEPGIYIPKDDVDVDPKWRGIGIRIEDNIHILNDSYENLTFACPKEIDEIENLAQR
jgi:Xaa-Pro aminopeptidase